MIDHGVLREFAGPAATVFASITALVVTWKFQSANLLIARERLRYDSASKRVEVFEAARDLLLFIMRNPDPESPEAQKVLAKHRTMMSAAPFWCGDQVEAFCKKVDRHLQDWGMARYSITNLSQFPPSDYARIQSDWQRETARTIMLMNEAYRVFAREIRSNSI